MAWNGERNREVTFLGVPFGKQTCPTCNTTVEYLKLGEDKKRTTMNCPRCADPELFIEASEDVDAESELPDSG